MTNKSLNVFVLTYNKPILDIQKDDWHTPLQVGAACSNLDICDLKDNTGENISHENPFYTETTGHYWVWKNDNKYDYVGFEHHRRHFGLTKEQVMSILSEKDIIVVGGRVNTNVEHHYQTYQIPSDLDDCEEIIKNRYPEYAEDYDKYIKNGKTFYSANMFITTKENFAGMEAFIQDVISEFRRKNELWTMRDVRRHVETSGQKYIPDDHRRDGLSYVDFQMRIGGELHERLMTLYVLHNFRNIYEAGLIDLEPEYRAEKMKVMLCCIARKENRNIREYVEHYRGIGVDNICLFDNNHDGEEDFHDAIGDYIDSGYVILKDYRNRSKCQLAAYDECYKEYGGTYDWIMFFDSDEFMFLSHNRDVKRYLGRRLFDKYDLIHVNWLDYGDNGNVRNDGRQLRERFPQPLDPATKSTYNFPDNYHVKSIVRGGLKNVLWVDTPHTPFIEGLCCNGTGIQCEGKSPLCPYDYRLAGLKHYCTKTAEEYAYKILRGFPDGNQISARRMVEIFFKRNEITQEKVDVFKEITGVDASDLLPHKFEGEKRKDVQIFSLCYAKKDFQFMDDAVVTPLQVGAANGTDVCELKDNTRDNISDRNYFFIENTGTYWIWKNVKDAEYKGQMQYRRPLSGVCDTMNFEQIFKDYDVITCEPFHHPDHKTPTAEEPMVISADTVEQGYAFSNCIDDLYIMEIALKTAFPEYSEDYDRFIKNGPDLYYSNGFIMRSEDYDRYCEFLFRCLEGYLSMVQIDSYKRLYDHVKYNISVGKYPRYGNNDNVSEDAIKWQCSIGGFLSERLWTLWLQHNFKPERIYKLPYIKMEEGMYT